MASPKSYSIWQHRIWTIGVGLTLEREVLAATPPEEVEGEERPWRSTILEMELKLCSKMLMMDERNFHCWNYRKQVVDLYCKEIGERVDGEKAQTTKNAFLQEECDMAKAIINKNFSNYSAWHYRGKLLPFIKTQAAESAYEYALPLSIIREDLELLKHAYFTDPKDQSPWNYHAWLMSLLSPIQVVAVQYIAEKDGKAGFTIGLSH